MTAVVQESAKILHPTVHNADFTRFQRDSPQPHFNQEHAKLIARSEKARRSFQSVLIKRDFCPFFCAESPV